MKLVSFYTDSHAELMEKYCLPSVISERFEHEIVRSDKQLCKNGLISDQGFIDCMLEKLDILAAQPAGTKILYVDADCVLFDGAHDFFDHLRLDENQIAFQWDDGQLCCGVALFEQTEATRKWWRFVRDYSYVIGMMDQTAMNKLLNDSRRLWISVAALPYPAIGNWSHVRLQNKLWDGERFSMPMMVYLWHANFTIGVENKKKMLDFVVEQYCQRQAIC